MLVTDREQEIPARAPEVRAEPKRVSAFRLTHLPPLDGLRGLAVLAVVLFHAGHLDGGYLGVDLFFTLSGFLITTLLLEERQDTGTIAFKWFWIRRARRLLPALFAMLAFVVVYAAVFADATELGRIRADAMGSVLYVANWRSIIAGQGYWDLFGAPSPLQHTWSLAIEEQFYLVWPLLLGGLLWWRHGSRRAVFALCVAFAVAGAVWMAIVFDPLDTEPGLPGHRHPHPGPAAGRRAGGPAAVAGPVHEPAGAHRRGDRGRGGSRVPRVGVAHPRWRQRGALPRRAVPVRAGGGGRAGGDHPSEPRPGRPGAVGGAAARARASSATASTCGTGR